MWWDELKTKKNLEIGDYVAIKGMRSNIDARKRMEGEIINFSNSSVIVNCGAIEVHANVRSVILLKKAEKSL